jgi:membrane protein required for colicin V production
VLDLILGALLVGLAIRGWMRGLVKEIISLAVLIVGTLLSFRLSTPLGRVFAAMSGASPDAARVVAGMFIFLIVAVGAVLVSRMLHLGMRVLPGVTTLNRAAGAGLSLFALVLVVTLALSLATVVPLPEALADEIETSAVADALTEPDGVPQRVLGVLSGDRVVAMTLRIRDLTGDARAVPTPGNPVTLPPALSDELERLPDAEDAVFELLNRERVGADASPLPRSSGLDQIAFDLAWEAYTTGALRVRDEAELREVLNDNGLPSIARAQLVALAASPEAGHVAMADEPTLNMTGSDLTKAGVAVIQGPLGLLLVEVLTG